MSGCVPCINNCQANARNMSGLYNQHPQGSVSTLDLPANMKSVDVHDSLVRAKKNPETINDKVATISLRVRWGLKGGKGHCLGS